MGYVAVQVSSLRKAEWCFRQVHRLFKDTPGIQVDDRWAVADLAMEGLRKVIPMAVMAGPELDLDVAWVRELRSLAQRLSSRVHSARGLMIADKRRYLGVVAAAKRELDRYIQLDLFPGN